MNITDKIGIRALTPNELDEASGGVVFLAGMAAGAAMAGLAAIVTISVTKFGDLPAGTTKEDAASALGMKHLL
jgi:hypothetical protein